ncbi:MAG: class I SAM-dependent methyltransferase [Pseudomonadota bacterium]
MDIDEISREREEIIKKHGEWTAHNIHLKGETYTMGNRIAGDEVKLRRVFQIVSDISEKPLNQLRILDLACLEGLYGIEFARHDAEVVAIEGRKANFEKARFSKAILSLHNLDVQQGDVRNLSRERYGYFDVVLCLGILYHLNVPDVFQFLEQVVQVCTRLAVIDTHISLTPEKSFVYKGREYRGKEYIETWAASPSVEREKSSWASLDNPKSFWFTRSSLLNLLSHIGFTSVYECYVPEEAQKPADRITLAAIKGKPQHLISCPLLNARMPEEIPE